MDMINVGYISGFHGLKGEMKIKTTSDFSEERFKVGSHLILTNNQENLEVIVKSSRTHKGVYLISFENYNSLNDVEKFKGYALKVEQDNLYELADDEFYFFDLIGLDLFDYQDELIGKVTSIMETAANEVLIVKKENQQILIPFVSVIVDTVDLDNKKIKLFEVDGLW